MKRILKCRLLLACCLAFVLASLSAMPASATFFGFKGDYPVFVGDTIYYPEEYAYVYRRAQQNIGPLRMLLSAPWEPGKTQRNFVFEQQDPDRISTGDRFIIGDKALNVVVVDCGAGYTLPADLDPLPDRDTMEQIRRTILIVNLKMLEYEAMGALEVRYFVDLPDLATVEAFRFDAFSFFAYDGSEESGYRVFVGFQPEDTQLVRERAEAFGLEWTLLVFDPLVSVLGDADLDGKITAKDARIALRTSAKLEVLSLPQFFAIDLDGDGKVTAAEARKILRASARLETL